MKEIQAFRTRLEILEDVKLPIDGRRIGIIGIGESTLQKAFVERFNSDQLLHQRDGDISD